MMTKTIFSPSDYYSVYKSCNSTHPRPMSRASASVRWLSDEDEKWGSYLIKITDQNIVICNKTIIKL